MANHWYGWVFVVCVLLCRVCYSQAGGVTPDAGFEGCQNVQPWIYSPFDDSPCSRLDGRLTAGWNLCQLDGDEDVASCFCRDQFATCCGNWTWIPKFKAEVRFLDFSRNALTAIDDNTLHNVTQLKWLVLNKNEISTVADDALLLMTSLECFEFADNDDSISLNPVNLTNAVNTLSTLKLLALNFTHFANASLQEDGLTYIMRNLDLQNLTKLFLVGGNMREVYLSDVVKLTNLQVLSVASHSITDLFMCREESFHDNDFDLDLCMKDDCLKKCSEAGITFEKANHTNSSCENFQLPNLRLLDVSYNLLVAFPNFCQRGGDNQSDDASVLPALRDLHFSLNAIVKPERHQMRCLPSLKFLSLVGNPLRRIKKRVFQGLPKLDFLDLRFTNVMFIEEEAFNHSSLRSMNVESSNWFFDIRHMSDFHPNLFVGSNLTWIDISYNVFRYVDPNRLRHILRPLRTARQLYMAELGLFVIPSIITTEFTDLEVLWFNGNLVSWLKPNTFENLTRLTQVNLRDNQLSSPNVETILQLLKGKGREVTVYVDLAWNPYSCQCDLLEFLTLLRAHIRADNGSWQVVHYHSGSGSDAQLALVKDEYRCYSPASLYNVSLFDLNMTHQMCLLSEEQLGIILSVCAISIVVFIVYTVLHRYRWQVRYWLYTMHVRWHKRQDRRRRRSRFGAFVSYCQRDSNFVLTKVLPALESTYRLPLCIHERDFVPGRYISQNIVERMEESNHVLLVLSNAFLRSDWCRFELFVAQQYGLVHRRIPITVLLLEPINVALMDGHVIMMLQMPVLEWPGSNCGDRARHLFWRRLGESLNSAHRRP